MPDRHGYREHNAIAEAHYMRAYREEMATDAQRIMQTAHNRGILSPADVIYLSNSVVARRGVEEIYRILIRISSTLAEPTSLTVPQQRVLPDAAKLAAIDEIYDALQAAEVVYDLGCDVVGGPWRSRLKEDGPATYARMLEDYRRKVSDAIVVVADLAGKKHSKFPDIYKFRMDEFGFQSAVFNPIGEFLERLKKLPNDCTDGILDLIEPDAKKLLAAIAAFGKWSRESQDKFRKMREL
ncbi:hypothetical protein [Reyranella sp.]|uniref:hypothetical protein n=1 Tax=Reyranella sp. TaxID=1929291 RepID=UPI003BA8D697